MWFNLQEELLNGYKDLCEKIIKPKLKDYFKEIPRTPFKLVLTLFLLKTTAAALEWIEWVSVV